MVDHTHISQLISIKAALENATYNPKLGGKFIKLEDTEIEGIRVSLMHVQIDPGSELTAHVHEHNGEVLQVLSPVTVYFGKLKKLPDGTYQMKDEKIDVQWDTPLHMVPEDTVRIPEGIAHFFINPSKDSLAHIQFIIPNSHFEANEKGIVDRKLVTRPQV